MHGVVRTPETTGQGRFPRTHHPLPPRGRHRPHEVLEGTTKLLLRPAPRQRGRLGGHRLGELLQRVVDREGSSRRGGLARPGQRRFRASRTAGESSTGPRNELRAPEMRQVRGGFFANGERPWVRRRPAGLFVLAALRPFRAGETPAYPGMAYPRTTRRGGKIRPKALRTDPKPGTTPSPWGRKYLAFLSTLPVSRAYEQRTDLGDDGVRIPRQPESRVALPGCAAPSRGRDRRGPLTVRRAAAAIGPALAAAGPVFVTEAPPPVAGAGAPGGKSGRGGRGRAGRTAGRAAAPPPATAPRGPGTISLRPVFVRST